MSEYGGSDAGVDISSLSDTTDDRSDSADIHSSLQDEEETVAEDSDESGSGSDASDSALDEDIDHESFPHDEYDLEGLVFRRADGSRWSPEGEVDQPAVGIFDTSDIDVDEWARQQDHLHHHHHHHHHHYNNGHGIPGVNIDHDQLAEDEEEESLFVNETDHNLVGGDDDDDFLDDFLGQDDLDAFDLLSSFATGNSPQQPGLSNSGTPLREILEVAAVFGAESLFRDPIEGSIRDQLIQFHQNNIHLHNLASSNRTSAVSMDRANPSYDELVRMEFGARGSGRTSRASRARPSQAPSGPAEVIDLTLDDDPQPVLPFPRPAAPVQPPRTNSRRSTQRSVPPPALNRSDTHYAGDGPNVINLVSDSEDETSGPTINAGRRPAGRRHNPPRMATARPPPLEPRPWLPNMHELFAPVFGPFMSRRPHQHRPLATSMTASDDVAIMGERHLRPHVHAMPPGFSALSGFNGLNIPGFGTIDLNYTATAHHPFQSRHGPPAVPKPKHEPPEAPREGFTRDTGEEVVAVCPSCEEELAYDPDNDMVDAAGPPSKKARTRRDKAEHHFFAVKGCGHVYCKRCYEGRSQSTRGTTYTGFSRPASSDGRLGKKTFCAVDGCEEEVGNKSAWVGIFL
ncbi:hypothetical protein MN608_00029 [Microdochium nivale]|nr:hypothetical protein MN608_00029 [Microdochium nivale]